LILSSESPFQEIENIKNRKGKLINEKPPKIERLFFEGDEGLFKETSLAEHLHSYPGAGRRV